jgi:hypothetical protein
MSTISLNAYEEAERTLARIEARRGITVHGFVTVLVAIALILVNVFVAPAFPWSAFAVGGLLVGFGFHFYFGWLQLEDNLAEHQRSVELHAVAAG